MTEYDDPDAVEAVLAGTASYDDDLSDRDQASVREIWAARLVESLSGAAAAIWLAAEGQPLAEADEDGNLVFTDDRLHRDLAVVVERAQRMWAPEVVRDWLSGRNAYLGGDRPIDVLLIRRDLEAVLQALETAERGGSA